MTRKNTPIDARAASAREALIQAAIESFGRDSFDSVSIRQIAEKAAANAAMISYYFGGKEGLYAAAIKHIANEINERMGPVVTEVQAALSSGEPDRLQSFDALCAVTDGMLEMLTRPESSAWARIILREQQDPSKHFRTLYEGAMGRIMQTCVLLHARILGRADPTAEDRLGAATLIAQVAFFRSNHAAVLNLMGWSSIAADELEVIKHRLHQNFARILGVNHE